MYQFLTFSYYFLHFYIYIYQFFTNFVQISTNLLYIEQISIIFYKFSAIFTIAYQFLTKVWSRGHLPSSKRCCWSASSKSGSYWPTNGVLSTLHTSTYNKHMQQIRNSTPNNINSTKREHKTILHVARITWAQESLKTDLKRWSYG